MISTNSVHTKNKSVIFPLLILFSVCAVIRLTGTMLLPFILAALISEIIFPISQKISAKNKISSKAASIILLTVTLLTIIMLLSILLSKTAKEINELSYNLKSGSAGYFFEKLSEIIKSFIQKLQVAFSTIPADTIDIQMLTKEAIASAASSIVNYLSSALLSVATKIPTIILFIMSTIISAYYFCTDRNNIYSYFSHMISNNVRIKARRLKRRILSILSKYLKACFILSTIIFIETFIGLSIIRVKYSFLIAAAAALSDLLPIIGAGTVLIPTAVYVFITAGAKKGILILILFALLTVTRQLTEPKIMGASLGLHPLAALMSICMGIGFFGFCGIFAGPIIAIVIKEILESQISESKTDTPQISAGDT